MKEIVGVLKVVYRVLGIITFILAIQLLYVIINGGDVNTHFRLVLMMTLITLCTLMPVMAWETYHEL
jgi:hypothetical protein